MTVANLRQATAKLPDEAEVLIYLDQPADIREFNGQFYADVEGYFEPTVEGQDRLLVLVADKRSA